MMPVKSHKVQREARDSPKQRNYEMAEVKTESAFEGKTRMLGSAFEGQKDPARGQKKHARAVVPNAKKTRRTKAA